MDTISKIIFDELKKYEIIYEKTVHAQIIFYVKKYLMNYYNLDLINTINVSVYNNVIKFKINNSTISTEIKMHEISLINYIKEKLPNVNIQGIIF